MTTDCRKAGRKGRSALGAPPPRPSDALLAASGIAVYNQGVADTILVVDDDPDVLRMVELILEKSGHEVVTASSPIGVSALVRRVDPKVLILDVMMPGLSGENLAKLVARAAGRRPIIFYSAMPEEELLMLTRRIPDSTYVSKGTPLQSLVDTVERMKRLYASQRP